jgi:hypothetical protein
MTPSAIAFAPECSAWCAEDVGVGEDRSKARVNVASRSRIKNRNWAASSPRSMSRLRACWVTQARVGGDPGDVHAAAVMLDHHEHIEAAKDGAPDQAGSASQLNTRASSR